MKRTAIILALTMAALPAVAQTDNTLYAKQFPGADVATKVFDARGSCNPEIERLMVIDPSLGAYPSGTMGIFLRKFRLSITAMAFPPWQFQAYPVMATKEKSCHSIWFLTTSPTTSTRPS